MDLSRDTNITKFNLSSSSQRSTQTNSDSPKRAVDQSNGDSFNYSGIKRSAKALKALQLANQQNKLINYNLANQDYNDSGIGLLCPQTPPKIKRKSIDETYTCKIISKLSAPLTLTESEESPISERQITNSIAIQREESSLERNTQPVCEHPIDDNFAKGDLPDGVTNGIQKNAQVIKYEIDFLMSLRSCSSTLVKPNCDPIEKDVKIFLDEPRTHEESLSQSELEAIIETMKQNVSFFFFLCSLCRHFLLESDVC